jgi:esterase/lipase
MGGLLALRMAAQIKPESLVLLAPALEVQHKSIKIVPLISPFAPFLPQIDTGWREEEEEDEELKEHGRKYWVRRDIKSLSQFVMLASETKKNLKNTDLPVLLVLSENDPVVSLKTAEVLNSELKRKPEKTIILKNCRHDIPNGNDKETVADAVIDWINS